MRKYLGIAVGMAVVLGACGGSDSGGSSAGSTTTVARGSTSSSASPPATTTTSRPPAATTTTEVPDDADLTIEEVRQAMAGEGIQCVDEAKPFVPGENYADVGKPPVEELECEPVDGITTIISRWATPADRALTMPQSLSLYCTYEPTGFPFVEIGPIAVASQKADGTRDDPAIDRISKALDTAVTPGTC